MLKGLASGLFGLLLTTIGLDTLTGSLRFTFGRTELMTGIDVVAAIVGLFAVSEMFDRIAHLPQRVFDRITLLRYSDAPKFDRSIFTAGRQHFSVWRESYRRHGAVVSPQGGFKFPSNRVPELDRMIMACRRQGAAVGAEGQRGDGVHVSGEGTQQLPRSHVP